MGENVNSNKMDIIIVILIQVGMLPFARIFSFSLTKWGKKVSK